MEHIISSCAVHFQSVPLLWMKHIMIRVQCCKLQESYVNSMQHSVDQMTPRREVLEEASTKFTRTRNTLHFTEPNTSLPFIQINQPTNQPTNTNYNTMLWKPSHLLLEWPGTFCTFVRIVVGTAKPTQLQPDTLTLHVDTSSWYSHSWFYSYVWRHLWFYKSIKRLQQYDNHQQ